jgi:hypothetical protein
MCTTKTFQKLAVYFSLLEYGLESLAYYVKECHCRCVTRQVDAFDQLNDLLSYQRQFIPVCNLNICDISGSHGGEYEV